jgi:hypothetical protein
MDGRGPWDLAGSIREHQTVMAWYGARNIPVELNEPHHWGMRDAPDTVYVAAAFLAAYNARSFGVRDYIAQLMFNSPPGHSDAADLAKMLAVVALVKPLENDHFRVWLQTRTGLLSYPLDPAAARAHLAASVYLQMALKPHIVHVVGHTEADHAASALDVIEACGLARRAIENALKGAPDMTADPAVQRRRDELVAETGLLLQSIRELAQSGVADPWADANTLAHAAALGLLDAPQLRGSRFAPGTVQTRIRRDGACVATDSLGNEIPEFARIASALQGRHDRS